MNWEYEIESFGIVDDDGNLDYAKKTLNELGAAGWEIFAVVPGREIPNLSKTQQTWLYAFAKRPYAGP